MAKPIYVLGTGLSHNGSAVLLKDGQISVAIEKERLSRIKHDGGNDSLAIQYCLDEEGITIKDLSLIVQNANFHIPDAHDFEGERLFAGVKDCPKIITIGHHLAHAYSAVGTCPFEESAVMVVDGCGSPLKQFLTMHAQQEHLIPPTYLGKEKRYCEKDSFYYFDGQRLKPLMKDFSEMSGPVAYPLRLPTTKHSIGGFYTAFSIYVFGLKSNDLGKLMGLASFGDSSSFEVDAFELREGQLFVTDLWRKHFTRPAKDYTDFKQNFSYYANVAKWVQDQVEKALISTMSYRLEKFPNKNLCYSGGVALNAVANSRLLNEGIVENLYVEPAAGDNGLALGCAFYGWLNYLGMPREKHNNSTCFGKKYSAQNIQSVMNKSSTLFYKKYIFKDEKKLLSYSANQLNKSKTIAWFQDGSEFGPRALGRRSILAHPGKNKLKDHINKNIKFREDFRPFAPAVLEDMAKEYFLSGRKSPYMILIDKTKPEYIEKLQNVTHINGTARVQTVEYAWNARFSKLLSAFHKQSGLAVLLNTSLNRKGMPMVETPEEAFRLFRDTDLDLLVIGESVLNKRPYTNLLYKSYRKIRNIKNRAKNKLERIAKRLLSLVSTN